ncbi:MAG: ImmA/IrrE family metallo-endopeptidase [Candidatus Lokiarchaeota archaeon]|nr:ImmA/IrrE family metallo-endopeptidase [Candidatus Lokiarchaeota archaeon]
MNCSSVKLLYSINKAETIVKELKIRDPSEISIRDIAMERGVYVKEDVLEGSEARLIRRGNIGIATISSEIPECGRKRFAIAHELGHFELHSESQLVECEEEDLLIWNECKVQEMESNQFAASLLMPYDLFCSYIDRGQPNFRNIKNISEKFRTSLTATALRYVSLSSEPCAIAITQDEKIRWYMRSKNFELYLKVDEKLRAYEEFNETNLIVDVPTAPVKVPAVAWIKGIKDPYAMIYEQSVKLKRYNILLSLLWIDDDIY